jgi:hypothetical protein
MAWILAVPPTDVCVKRKASETCWLCAERPASIIGITNICLIFIDVICYYLGRDLLGAEPPPLLPLLPPGLLLPLLLLLGADSNLGVDCGCGCGC